ncbi:MAG: hypothetical protein ACMUIP_03735 [bacterium]
MKNKIQERLAVTIFCLILALCLGMQGSAHAQFFPYFNPFLNAPPIRTNNPFAGYAGLSPVWNPVLPIVTLPPPVIRRPNALTTLTSTAVLPAPTVTNIKVLLPAGATTIVLNPYQSPVVVPITSVTIPVVTSQAQPILLAAGAPPTALNPSTSFLYSILAPTLGTPSVATILPTSIVSLLNLIL